MKYLLFSFFFIASTSFAKTDNFLQSNNRLVFIENKGQVTDQYLNKRTDIDYILNSNGVNIFIGEGKIHYQFGKTEGKKLPQEAKIQKGRKIEVDMYRLDVELIGANKNAVRIAEAQQPYFENHYTPSHEGIHVQAYKRIVYKDVYPNIDWIIHIKDNSFEYDFLVKSGGDPANIKLKYKGATKMMLQRDGSLNVSTPMGDITEAPPYAYEQDGKKIQCSFNLQHEILTFNIDNYKGDLVIDPIVTWGTYFGSIESDAFEGIVCDDYGSLYVAGYTINATNIATVGSHQSTFGGGFLDGILAKFDCFGNKIWCTYYGGGGQDMFLDLCIDFNGNIYASGSTESINNISTLGSHQPLSGGGGGDGMLVKFDTAGVRQWATFYGGNSDDEFHSICVDQAGNIFAAGVTNSSNAIATSGSHQPTINGAYDGFVVMFNSSGVRQWGTYYGGTQNEYLEDVDIDNTGNIFICGSSLSQTDIATPGSHQEQYLGTFGNGYLVKFNSTGVRQWGTYYGGGGLETSIYSLCTNNTNDIYIAGPTRNVTNISTPGSYQENFGGGSISGDGFLAKFNSSGTRQWGTYYGNSGNDFFREIKIKLNGNIYATGYTSSTSGISLNNSNQTTFGGGFHDGLLVEFNPNGFPIWGTYYGGVDVDEIPSFCFDNHGSLFIAGNTYSNDNISTTGCYQPTYGGDGDGFLVRFDSCIGVPLQPLQVTGISNACAGTTQLFSVPYDGATSYTWTLPIGWSGSSTTNTIAVITGINSGVITVTANNSCGSSTQQSLSVTIDNVSASIASSGSTTFCQGDSVILDANSGTGYTYQWQLNGISITGATNSSLTANSTGIYSVIVANTSGCFDTSAATTVTVNSLPAVPTAGSNSPVCVGGTINLTGITTTSGVTYTWTGPQGYYSNLQNPAITGIASANEGEYILEVMLNGCTSSDTTIASVDTAVPAQPGLITGAQGLCVGSNSIYSVPEVTGVDNYTWTLSSGITGISTTDSITITATVTGSSMINVTSENSCGSSVPQTMNISVYPTPVVTIIQTGNVLDAGTFASYEWYLNGNAIPGATSQTYTATQPGPYTVMVTDSNGCEGVSQPLTLGIERPVKGNDINLYPNPATDKVTITGSTLNATITVTNAIGQVLLQDNITNSKAYSFDVSKYVNGIYIVEINNDGIIYREKLVKN